MPPNAGPVINIEAPTINPKSVKTNEAIFFTIAVNGL